MGKVEGNKVILLMYDCLLMLEMYYTSYLLLDTDKYKLHDTVSTPNIEDFYFNRQLSHFVGVT